MKLAFGVATAGHPDILLIDEVIGVGDAKFMRKAHDRIEKLMHASNILVLTTHDNNIIKKFCNKVLVLEQGNMTFLGDVDQGIECYNNILNS
jgi:ABC-type polysaccharide/polyol phosphate transport system ATPase subunit